MLAGASLSLPACVRSGVPAATQPALCLPPVLASPDHVIRSVAGLRPYRSAGFVVREQALGRTRVVHNYGHGGAGITLSWGSSRLAVDLGLRDHSGPVAVLGAGALGLTTAKLLQEAGRDVAIYARDLPPDTTSNIAGGQISPATHYDDDAVTPEWRAQYAAAMDYSYRRFQISVGEDTGVRWLTTYNETRGAPLEEFDRQIMPAHRILREGEHPFPVPLVREWRTMYVETGRWLEHTLRDVLIGGATIERRMLESPEDVAALPETLVFNCTGLGARELFGDDGMIPVRGQLAILLPQPEIRHAYTSRAGYMFPRPDGIVLGGTFERRVEDATPQPDDIAQIVAAHAEYNSKLACTA